MEIIKKEGVFFYINEYFLKKRFPDTYIDMAYDYYDESESNGTLIIYYISDIEKLKDYIVSQVKQDGPYLYVL